MALIVAVIRTEHLQVTPELVALIGEFDEFKGAWRALGRIAPERLRQLRRVATIESVGSSTRIEGATLSDREVEALLARGSGRLATRDEQEVVGYAELMEVIFANHAAIPVTENFIKQLHATLLRYSEKDARHRGEYKKFPNSVEAFDAHGASLGVVFATATPFDTPREMAELVDWWGRAREDRAMHPLLAVGIFVVVFLAIHPFQDGNGRLSRALTVLLLLQAGYAYVPYSSIEGIIERSKEAYYLSLRRTQSTLAAPAPEWTPWLQFFLRALREQKARLESRIEREALLRASMPALSVTILELVAEHGPIGVGDLVRITRAARGTVKTRVAELVAAGELRRVGQGRGAKYLTA